MGGQAGSSDQVVSDRGKLIKWIFWLISVDCALFWYPFRRSWGSKSRNELHHFLKKTLIYFLLYFFLVFVFFASSGPTGGPTPKKSQMGQIFFLPRVAAPRQNSNLEAFPIPKHPPPCIIRAIFVITRYFQKYHNFSSLTCKKYINQPLRLP